MKTGIHPVEFMFIFFIGFLLGTAALVAMVMIAAFAAKEIFDMTQWEAARKFHVRTSRKIEKFIAWVTRRESPDRN
jgi:hypothetical protein